MYSSGRNADSKAREAWNNDVGRIGSTDYSPARQGHSQTHPFLTALVLRLSVGVPNKADGSLDYFPGFDGFKCLSATAAPQPKPLSHLCPWSMGP